MAENQEQNRGQVLMEWTFPEFERHQRSRGWYLGFLILISLFILFAVWQRAYTFIAVIILTAAVLILRFRQQPLTVHCAVRDEGLEVGERYFPWKDIKEFWIIYRPPEVKKVFFDFKTIRPSIDLPLQTENPVKLRQFLSERLVENTEREEEPSSDQLTRILKI
jgi:hypothetical protein